MVKREVLYRLLIEREKTNRALALQGWGPTLRLKVLRSSGAVAAVVGGGAGVGVLIRELVRLVT